MKRAIATLLVTGLGLALLVYSAARSLDFISSTLPPDKQVLAWFGLAALDGGLVLWLLHFLYSASGAWQRGIALLMVIVDFLGAAAMFTLDTLYRTGEAGMTTALTGEEIRAAVLGLSLVIAVNVAATVMTHIFDPDTRKKMAAEEAQDIIEDTAIKAISDGAPQLAAELAPQIAGEWMARMRSQYGSLYNFIPPALPARTVEGQPAQLTTHERALPKAPRKRRGLLPGLWRPAPKGKAAYASDTEGAELASPNGSGDAA